MLNQGLAAIPEKQRLKSRNKASRITKNRDLNTEPVKLDSNLKDIEKRILLKMKNNKTDRKAEELLVPNISKLENHIQNRYLRSPGSDKADNSFPKLANSSITSAYSSPYGKRTDQDQDLRLGRFSLNLINYFHKTYINREI